MGRLQEFPSVRFRASKPVGEEAGSGLETQALVSQRVALELDERLRHFQQAGQLPSAQTCDLIIVDRSAAAFRNPRHLSRAPCCTSWLIWNGMRVTVCLHCGRAIPSSDMNAGGA